jgi:hypothetical protein
VGLAGNVEVVVQALTGEMYLQMLKYIDGHDNLFEGTKKKLPSEPRKIALPPPCAHEMPLGDSPLFEAYVALTAKLAAG